MYQVLNGRAFISLCSIVSFLLLLTLVEYAYPDPNKSNGLRDCRYDCYIMEPGFSINIKMLNAKGQYSTFCHDGTILSIVRVMSMTWVEIVKDTGVFTVKRMAVYQGRSKEEVEIQARRGSYLTFIESKGSTEYHKMSTDGASCLLIDSDGDFSLKYHVIYHWYFILTPFGVLLFIHAKRLSEGTKCHYCVGAALAMVGFLHIPAYFCVMKLTTSTKRFEHFVKSFCLATAVSLLYFSVLIWYHYWTFLGLHCAVTGLCGAAYMYRYHTVSDTRTINIMMWALQLVSLFLIWYGVQVTFVGVTICLILCTCYHVDLLFIDEFETAKPPSSTTKMPKGSQPKCLSGQKQPSSSSNIQSEKCEQLAIFKEQRMQLLSQSMLHFGNDVRVIEFVEYFCSLILISQPDPAVGVNHLQSRIKHLQRLLHLAKIVRWETVMSIHDEFMRDIELGTKKWSDSMADIEAQFFQ